MPRFYAPGTARAMGTEPCLGLTDIVNIGGITLGKFTFEPGWRWSETVKTVVHTDSCQNNHLGFCTAGH